MELKEVGNQIAAGLNEEVDGLLDQLGATGLDIRERAHILAVIQAQVAVLALAGQDVSIETAAARSSIQSLKSAGMTEVADGVRELVFAGMAKILQTALVATA